MLSKSIFITFEGGEGAGKSTLIHRLEEHFIKNKQRVIVTREPGGTPLGEQVRQLLLNTEAVLIGSKAELLLFLAARAQHVEEVIKPALEQGKIVLCDRFNDSTVAYQGYARELGAKTVQELCAFVCGKTVPDLTFYLDIDPRTGMDRAIRQQRNMDRMEKEKVAFHNKVREGFLAIADKEQDRVYIIDASQTADEVFQQTLRVIQHKTRQIQQKKN